MDRYTHPIRIDPYNFAQLRFEATGAYGPARVKSRIYAQ